VQLKWNVPRKIDAVALVPPQNPNKLTEPEIFHASPRLPPRRSYTITFLREEQIVFQQQFHAPDYFTLRTILPFFSSFEPVRADTIIIQNHDTNPDAEDQLTIGEFYAFTGARNIAHQAKLSSSGDTAEGINPKLYFLCDNRTPLGLPQQEEPHKFAGYASGGLAQANERVTLDLFLTEPLPIDEVRFYPIERLLAAGKNTAGYPQQMKVEILDPDSTSFTSVHDFKNHLGESPGLNPVPLHFKEVTTQHVRLTLIKHWKPTTRSNAITAFSEIELRHRGARIPFEMITAETSKNNQEMRKTATGQYWSKKGLCDGMTTKGRIIHEREWLKQLAERADLLIEQNNLLASIGNLSSKANRLCWRMTLGPLLLLFILLLYWQARTQISHQTKLQKIREQLGADLHDDIGSNLSSISLLSQILHQQHKDDPKPYEKLLGLVQDSQSSLKEITALTSPRITKTQPLIHLLEKICTTHSGGIQTEFQVDAGLESIDYPPAFRRNLRFFLKECLNNAVNHSKADMITVRIGMNENKAYFMETKDNGIGFSHEKQDEETALSTLRIRAEEMGCPLTIRSSEGNGCLIHLILPKPLPV
jgi:signal transduction histidine kinase